MPAHRIKILLVDDDEEDAFITEELLNEAPGDFELTWLTSYNAALDVINASRFDVCLIDYRIGGETGIEFIEKAAMSGMTCPMILLTGVGQHEIDVAASEVGAADFLDKTSLSPVLLERAIRYAIAHASALHDLADQRQVLTTTLESMQGGIVAFDASGEVMAANQRFESLMAEIVPRSGKETTIDAIKMARQILESVPSRDRDQVVPMEAPNGQAFEIRISPMPGRGSVLLIVDVTQQKTLQRRILEAKAAAEEASTAKSVFLAKVSHELRTPLNGVFGMSQLLKLTDLTADQSAQIGRLEDSAKGLLALIEDLLDVSMVEQGRFQVRVEPISIHEIVDEACSIAIAASVDAGIEIKSSVEVDTRLSFHGDSKRIKQILTNFLNNAIKHAEKSDVFVEARQTVDGWVRFTVRDNGKGIALEDQAHIFERFKQVAPGQMSSKPGVGLGLSIAKEIVEQMSGRIGVVSAMGDGAEFWFELPLGSEKDQLSNILSA